MDFIADYLRYMRETEPPFIYHRWSAICTVASFLGRSCYIPLGHFRIFPNIYTMFIGEPASRKSTAIKLAKELGSLAGYDTFAADKTRKEKFLLDLEGIIDDTSAAASRYSLSAGHNSGRLDPNIAKNLFGLDTTEQEPREVWIVADEWNEYAPIGDSEFYSLLGTLWDWDDSNRPYTYRLKNGNVSIYQPTINLISGNTQERFAEAFPPQVIGQGFLSRVLLIYGERSKRKYFDPPPPDESIKSNLVQALKDIRALRIGKIEIAPPANKIREDIYNNWIDMTDVRFKYYNGRRYTQLLKLMTVLAICSGSEKVLEQHIIEANTVLAAAEHNMPKALGEFGMSRFAEVNNKIMDMLYKTHKPLGFKEIFRAVHRDVEKHGQLVDIMHGLMGAGKVQVVGKGEYLAIQEVQRKIDHVDFSLLTEEERSML